MNWFGRAFAIGLILFWANSAVAQTNEWKDNLTRAQVVAALGQPLRDAQFASSETMTYAGGLQIQLEKGIVTDISGAAVPASLKPAPLPAAVVAAPPTLAPTIAPAASSTTPPVTATSPANTSPDSSPAAVSSAPSAPANGDAASGDQDSEKIINDFSTSTILPAGVSIEDAMKNPKKLIMGVGTAPAGTTAAAATPAAAPSDWSQPNTLEGFFAGLLLKTMVMTLVLKVAFAHKDFPALWGQVALVAFGVSLTNQILAFLFTLNSFGEIAKLVQADQLVAAVVLLALITKFTAAKQLHTAIGITVIAMAANVALGYAQLFFL